MGFVVSVFIAALLFAAGVLSARWKHALQLELRVTKVIRGSQTAHPYGTFSRMMKAFVARFEAQVMRWSPQSLITRTEQQMRAMGERGSAALRKWLAVKLVWTGLTVFISVVVVVVAHDELAIILGVGMIVVSLLIFRMMVRRRLQRFQAAIRKQLPNMLDLLAISVEAGLGFDQALERNSRHLPIELGREVHQIMAEMSLGKTRREALRDAGGRIGVEEFVNFVNAVIQADRLGMGMAGVLRVQSTETRRRLSEKVKEQAMKAPVKVLFPLVLFLFPAMFIVILGPAAIRIATLFIK